MSFTPEEKEEIYKNTNIIHKDDDFLIVEPLSKDSIEYYGGPKNMIDFYGRKYRYGTIYLIIDTTTSPSEVLSIFTPEESNDIEYFFSDGDLVSYKEFFDVIPSLLFGKVQELVIQNTTYSRLLRITQGEELEFVDELITKIKYNKKNPKKTLITISFDDEEKYFETIGVDEHDMWIFTALFSYYGGSLNLMDSYTAYDEFKEGYLFGNFSDENMGKLNEIIKYISPENYNFKPENEWEKIIGEKLLDLFGQTEYIIDTFAELENECRDNAVKKEIIDDLCDKYVRYGIFVQSCFLKYYSSAQLLISAYDKVGVKTLTIGELMNTLVEPYVSNNFHDYIYEIYCNENYNEEFNKEVTKRLDNILEDIEDSDKFLDIKGFNELYTQAVSKYGINQYNVVPKDKNKKFKILTIDPSKNKMVIEVVNWDTNEFERRELDIEEFNNFLYTGELF